MIGLKIRRDPKLVIKLKINDTECGRIPLDIRAMKEISDGGKKSFVFKERKTDVTLYVGVEDGSSTS